MRSHGDASIPRPNFYEAARSIGPPLYVIEGLQPARLSGCGTSGAEYTSVDITCGTELTISIEIQINRALHASWSLFRMMPMEKDPEFPIILDRLSTTIEVNGTHREITVVTNGPNWAGTVEVDGRWIGIDSRSVAIDDVALVSADIDALDR
jgi:hypothetical protein